MNEYKAKATLNSSDWTTEDVVSHLLQDTSQLKETLVDSIRNHDTDSLLLIIRCFHGKVRTWLDLYSEVRDRTYIKKTEQ